MHFIRVVLAVGFLSFSPAAGLLADDKPREETVTLMGTLQSWMYPEAKLKGGATMSDGGQRGVQSVKCQTVLVTPDGFDKVVAFYEKKLNAGQAEEPKSVASQDDSKDRPVSVRVFSVNKAKTSTTVVVSRAKGETETHIAWTHYIRLGEGK